MVVNSPDFGFTQNFCAFAFLMRPGTFRRSIAASVVLSMLVTGTAPVMIIGLPCSAHISRIFFVRTRYVGKVIRPGSQPSQKSTARRAAAGVAPPHQTGTS